MTSQQINPTRMERLRQRDQLQTATRAQHLLKDKSDEMMRTFNQLIKQNQIMRRRLHQELPAAIKAFLTASAQMTPTQIDAALSMLAQPVTLQATTQNLMGLVIPQVKIADVTPQAPILVTTPLAFDQAIAQLSQLSNLLIALANTEKTCQMLAHEMEKVRRRLNSLQYNLIPQTAAKIKAITMKLEEQQRETQVRLLKVKALQNPEA